jgi:hypothetical protein
MAILRNKTKNCFTISAAILAVSFFALSTPADAQLVVDLNLATVKALCVNNSVGASGIYEFRLRPSLNFQSGGIISRTMSQGFFPSSAPLKVDQGLKLYVPAIAGGHTKVGPATSYNIQGVVTSIITAPRAAIAVSVVPYIATPCIPSVQPDSGGGVGGGGFQCPPGTFQVGNTQTCAASTASLPYSSPDRLVATTFDRPALQTQAAPADPAQDLTKWEGVSWQVDHADN